MAQHPFIFEPGKWIGEGKIKFSSALEDVKFYTKWNIPKSGEKIGKPEMVICSQQVEMQGNNEQVINRFYFHSFTPTSFGIELENDLVGKVQGKGIIDDKTFAWEFRGHPGFEGFEVYELLDNGDYMLHAEYASPDQFRTIIDGRIWKKSE